MFSINTENVIGCRNMYPDKYVALGKQLKQGFSF